MDTNRFQPPNADVAARLDERQFQLNINRRTFLGQAAYGLGGMALACLLEPKLIGKTQAADAVERWKGVVNPPHFPPRAKRVIHLCMAGGPSHLESFDFKPELKRIHGEPFPESFTKGQQLAQLQNMVLKARGPFVDFQKRGQAGQEVSDLFPYIGGIADDLCIVRSMHTEQINHDPAHAFMNAGSIIKGRPSMGSWLLYGIGAETDELPGFVVLNSAGKAGLQPVSARQWSSGFLPSKFQGILFQSKGDAVHYVRFKALADALPCRAHVGSTEHSLAHQGALRGGGARGVDNRAGLVEVGAVRT